MDGGKLMAALLGAFVCACFLVCSLIERAEERRIREENDRNLKMSWCQEWCLKLRWISPLHPRFGEAWEDLYRIDRSYLSRFNKHAYD